MKNILAEIITNTKTEVAQRKEKITLDKIQKKIQKKYRKTKNIIPHQHNDSKFPKIIAEIKIKSPSGGILAKMSDVFSKITEYELYGAQAISVVTDQKYFGGSLELLENIRSKTNLPILQKDFVIDAFQIYEAALYGADALLLIARILSQEELQIYVNLCHTLSIEPLVEVYDDVDLKKALNTKTTYIGINARNLDTFAIDIKNACTLAANIPTDRIFVGLSGIKTKDEVELYKAAGAQAVVVGTTLMKSSNVKKTLEELLS